MAKLFGSFTSPFVRHCRIAFLEENIDFEFIVTDYAQSATQSPTKRVPFLEYDQGLLTDSTAILQWIRQQGQRPFLPTAQATNLYHLANTTLDTAINLFLLEKENLTPANVEYLQRQQARITSCLACLEEEVGTFDGQPNEAEWRVACLLDWARYRKRFEFSQYEKLHSFFRSVCNIAEFEATAPPPA